jgi:hypothetical protein
MILFYFQYKRNLLQVKLQFEKMPFIAAKEQPKLPHDNQHYTASLEKENKTLYEIIKAFHKSAKSLEHVDFLGNTLSMI